MWAGQMENGGRGGLSLVTLVLKDTMASLVVASLELGSSGSSGQGPNTVESGGALSLRKEKFSRDL